MNAKQFDSLVLELPCDHCKGSGLVWDDGSKCPCTRCGGAGHVPTDLGEKILTLVRHNSSVRVNAELYVSGA